MHTIQNFGAVQAPPHPEILRRARVAARLSMSPALADVVALLAYGPRRRDDALALAGVTASRIGGAHG